MDSRFDWRAERDPSYEDIVFCLDRAWNEEEEAVEALDGVCNITDMITGDGGKRGEGQAHLKVRMLQPIATAQNLNFQTGWPQPILKRCAAKDRLMAAGEEKSDGIFELREDRGGGGG